MANYISVDLNDPYKEECKGGNPQDPIQTNSSMVLMGEQESDLIEENLSPEKRRGGRKPIYATSEERKQRNRQAQAAFRERRIEYIRHLEDTIKHHETNLHCLHIVHRSATEECLMLRYKNSLLERILFEKGIDAYAELRAKSDSSNLGQQNVPQSQVQIPTTQRANSNMQQISRLNLNMAPKLEIDLPLQSPQSTETRSSQISSPSSHSMGSVSHELMTNPASCSQFQYQQQLLQTHQLQPPNRVGDLGLITSTDALGCCDWLGSQSLDRIKCGAIDGR